MKRPFSLRLSLASVFFFAATLTSARVVLPRLSDSVVLDLTIHARPLVGAILLLIPLLLVVVPLLTLILALFDLARGFPREALLAGATSLALLLVPIVWFSFAESFAAREESRVNRAWGEVFDPMDAFTARYPNTALSEGALKLEAAAARIGIEMNSNGTQGQHPAKSDQQAYERVRKGLFAFVSAQVGKVDEAPATPPPDVSAWLSSHDAEILALVTDLRQGGPIVLETDWTARERPLPSLLGLRGVQCVLLLHALEKERAGDSRAATETLEASWQMGGALRDRGELISQLLAIALDGMTLSALRQVREVPPSWQHRITEHNHRASLLRSLEGEAWQMSARVKRVIPDDSKRALATRWLWVPVEGPYMRLMASDFSEVLRKMVVQLKTSDPCSLDLVSADQKVLNSIAWWNFLGRIAAPSLGRAWRSAVRMALEVELTQKVLAARTLKAKTGAWPAEVGDLESTVCRDTKWKYETTQGGGVSITFGGNGGFEKPLGFSSKLAVPPQP